MADFGIETCATSVTSVGFSAHVAGEAPGRLGFENPIFCTKNFVSVLKVEGLLNLIYGYFGGGVKTP